MKPILIALLLAACDIPRAECYGSGTCGSDAMCLEGTCRQKCRDDAGCEPGEVCWYTEAHAKQPIGAASWAGPVCLPVEMVGE